MNVPPAILDLKVASEGQRRFRLWLPLFLLWPLELALGVLSVVLTLLVDAVLLAMGQRYHHYTLLIWRVFEATTELRGTVVRVHGTDADVDMVFI
jgi:hypothetical protein